MSATDANESLPIRTETNGDVVAQLVDGTVLTQKLAIDASGRITVKLTDASGLAINLGQQLMAASVPVTFASDQTTLPVKDLADGPVAPGAVAAFSQLAGGQFNTALPTLTNAQQAAIQLDASGRLIIRPLTSADVVTAAQGAPNTAANGWPVKVTDGTNTQAVKAASTAALAADPSAVVALSPNSPLPSGSNALGSVLANMQVASAPVTALNPVPVVLTASLPGTEVNDYVASLAVAAGSSANHDYTITATKTFKGKKIWASGSGKIKIEVQVSPDGTTFNTKWVAFNSVADPNISIDLDMLTFTDSGTGSKIRIIKSNLDKNVFDIHSTISGNEI